MTVYKSKVDWWLAAVMTLPVIGGIAVLVSGIATGQGTLALTGGGVLVGYALLLGLLVVPVAYTLDDKALRVKSGAVLKIEIPWDRLISAELSSNPISGPALSMRRINVEYRKASGREGYVLISPTDREAFLRDLVAASPRHQIVDGKVVGK
jgi:hypothetical protein